MEIDGVTYGQPAAKLLDQFLRCPYFVKRINKEIIQIFT